MSHRVELHDTVMDWEIYSVADAEANHPAILAIDKALRSWRRQTQMSTVEFLPAGTLLFNYECKHQDLREVTGVYDFTGELTDPEITVSCPDFWRITDLFRRDLTDAIIQAVQEIGITSLNVVFN